MRVGIAEPENHVFVDVVIHRGADVVESAAPDIGFWRCEGCVVVAQHQLKAFGSRRGKTPVNHVIAVFGAKQQSSQRYVSALAGKGMDMAAAVVAVEEVLRFKGKAVVAEKQLGGELKHVHGIVDGCSHSLHLVHAHREIGAESEVVVIQPFVGTVDGSAEAARYAELQRFAVGVERPGDDARQHPVALLAHLIGGEEHRLRLNMERGRSEPFVGRVFIHEPKLTRCVEDLVAGGFLHGYFH